MTDWLKPFTLEHSVTLLVIGILVALMIGLGLYLRERDQRNLLAHLTIGEAPNLEATYRSALGCVGLLFALVYQGYWLMPSRFDVTVSLPLHACDVMIILTPLSMLFTWRVPRTLAYFWGIGLSSLGLIMPVETSGPDQVRFWIFWIAHVQVVSFGLYHVIVGGYRPRGSDVLRALGMGLAYLLAIMVVNEHFGLNYGYVGSTGNPPWIVAKLGDWPLRVVVMSAIAGVGFMLMWLPWRPDSHTAHPRKKWHG